MRPVAFGAHASRVWLLAFLLGMVGPTSARAAPADENPTASPSSEITFPSPLHYAVVIRKADNASLLLGRGETVFHPRDPSRFAKIEEIQADALVVRTPTGRTMSVRVGTKIPGPPGFVFARSALLGQLQYRYRSVDRVTRVEPVLVAVEGATAVLEVEVARQRAVALAPAGPATARQPAPVLPHPAAVHAPMPANPPPPPPTRALLDEDLLAGVEVHELAQGQYEVARSDFRAVLENTGRVLADLRPLVLPSFSWGSGFEYKITSAASDGVLGAQGFTVYDAKLATRAGIEIGDRILNVNGRAVDGLASLYRIYQELRATPAVARIEVELERAGKRLTKTYQLR